MTSTARRVFLVDAFANGPFTGNPAGVCPLDRPADDDWMQKLAMEMNQAETAYFVSRADGDYDLRWFAPAMEIDLCGHATLASAHVLWDHLGVDRARMLKFHTKSGVLTAEWVQGLIRLDFPATPPSPCDVPSGLAEALGTEAKSCCKSKFDYLVEVESVDAVKRLSPDFRAMSALPVRGVIVTSKSEDPSIDFVSRFFAPAAGVNEDHATGSAHCCLAPYWSEKLGKSRMMAHQLSPRGGWLEVECAGDRVYLDGRAFTVFEGTLV